MTNSENEAKALSLNNEATNFLKEGNYQEALTASIEAFADFPANSKIQTVLFFLLSRMDGYQLPAPFTNAIAKIAEHGKHDIQQLAMIIRNKFDCNEEIETLTEHLKRHEVGQPLADNQLNKIIEIFDDRLTRLIMTKAISISYELEMLITILRHLHLSCWASGNMDNSPANHFPDLLPLIACQAFNTQYIFEVTANETESIAALRQAILNQPNDIAPENLALLGCYVPLADTLIELDPDILEALGETANNWSPYMRIMWRQQILEVGYERVIQASLQQLTNIEDIEQDAVKRHYDQWPFPSWQSANLEQSNHLSDVIKAKLPKPISGNLPSEDLNILVAGCGTGQQIIDLSSDLNHKNILAIDISRPSLAYAQRMMEDLSVSNVHFAQANIEHIGGWDASFDIIACTGVLHHMADPVRGFQNLIALSKPHSAYVMGVYSERGRAEVTAARDYISNELMSGARNLNIAAVRKQLRELPYYHPAASVALSPEFYSTNGLMDYIFNSREHYYSPRSLKTLLASVNLKFCGFLDLRTDLETKYQLTFPDDSAMTNLDNWEKFEQLHPETFGEMMQFICCNDTPAG